MLAPCHHFPPGCCFKLGRHLVGLRDFPPESGSKIAPLVDLVHDCTPLGPRERPERPVPLRFALRLRPLVLNLSLLQSLKRLRPLIRQRPFIKQDHAPIPSVRISDQHKRHSFLSDLKQAAILLFSSNRFFHLVIPAAVLRPLFNPAFNTSSRHKRQGFSIEQDRFT